MKRYQFFVAVFALGLAACKPSAAPETAAPAAAPAAPTFVTVNGKAISEATFNQYVKAVTGGKTPGDLSPEDRAQVTENLVRLELLAQQAERDGITREPEIASTLEVTRLNLLQQASAQRYLKDRVPTEEELRTEYELQVANAPLLEYQVRHIVVDSEVAGQKVVEQLRAGQNFAAVARRMSTEKESAKAGGDLGWFPANRTVAPTFSQAVTQLKKGEYTPTPVRTQFGWHVIQLQNTRERLPPAFEEVKEQIGQIVLNKKFKSYSDEMIKAAKVDPPLATAPAAADAAPAAPAPGAAATAPPAQQ